MMTNNPARPLHLRIALVGDFAIGPGKADLLEGIRDTGSIAAAGRRMKMSYKRAWSLVEAMNVAFREPVVLATILRPLRQRPRRRAPHRNRRGSTGHLSPHDGQGRQGRRAGNRHAEIHALA